MEVSSLGNNTRTTWIPRDMQISHTPQLDLSIAYLHFDGTNAGYTAHHLQHHASEVSAHHARHEGNTSYLNGTAHRSIYQ
jgi:hypothetical protein